MRPRTINAPEWLTARPIAHRGLHSCEKGLIENTVAAAEAAAAKNYAIECDVQRSRDGEAVVFHDASLERLMRQAGRVDSFSADELKRFSYKDCDQKIVSLADFLGAIGGRVPVVVEIKSFYDGDMRLPARVVAAVANSSWPVALKSFDPDDLIYLRRADVGCPVGLVAQADYNKAEWANLPHDKFVRFVDLRDFPVTLPDFLSWNHVDLPHAVPVLCRAGIGMPVMTWAVRSEAASEQARIWADQIIFEGFEP